jgi:hypothetical protein
MSGGVIQAHTLDDLKASFQQWINREVQFGIAEKQLEIATFFLDALQVYAPVWSGRYVGSINVSLGSPDETSLPRNPYTEGAGAIRWPNPVPAAPGYTFPDGAAIVDELLSHGERLAYAPIYITNSVPYADLVEGRNGTFELAVGITDATFGGGVSGI